MAGNDALREWLASPVTDGETQSPIENMMYRALLYQVRRYEHFISFASPLVVAVQDEVGPYKADFCIHGERFVVVECDGHAFHERTKEQAARDKKRDRYMAEHGHTVLRFAGSEIWANPFACAEQAVRLASGGIDLGDLA